MDFPSHWGLLHYFHKKMKGIGDDLNDPPRSFYFWSWNFMNIIRETNFKMGEGVKKLERQDSVRKLEGAFRDETHTLGT